MPQEGPARVGQLEALPPSCLQLKCHVSLDRAHLFLSFRSPGPHGGAQPSSGRADNVVSSNSLSNDPLKLVQLELATSKIMGLEISLEACNWGLYLWGLEIKDNKAQMGGHIP